MQIPDVCGRRYRVEHLAKQLQPDVGGSVRKVQRRYRHAQILPHEASRRKNCRQLSWIRKQFLIPEDEVFLNNGTVPGCRKNTRSAFAALNPQSCASVHGLLRTAPRDRPVFGKVRSVQEGKTDRMIAQGRRCLQSALSPEKAFCEAKDEFWLGCRQPGSWTATLGHLPLRERKQNGPDAL